MQLLVSRIEAGFATLVTEDHHFLELPLHMCPPDIRVGCVVRVDIKANEAAENEKLQKVLELQRGLMSKYGGKKTEA